MMRRDGQFRNLESRTDATSAEDSDKDMKVANGEPDIL